MKKLSAQGCFQQIIYCFGTEGRTLRSAIRICVIDNAVPFMTVWLILLIALAGILFSNGISVMIQNRQLEVIPYDGYNDTGPYMFDNDELFWFLQISDLHLSGSVPGVYQRFEQFLKIDLPTINPKFVFASGDLVDQSEETGYFHPIRPSRIEPVCKLPQMSFLSKY
jgi:hypothetical protein